MIEEVKRREERQREDEGKRGKDKDGDIRGKKLHVEDGMEELRK